MNFTDHDFGALLRMFDGISCVVTLWRLFIKHASLQMFKGNLKSASGCVYLNFYLHVKRF